MGLNLSSDGKRGWVQRVGDAIGGKVMPAQRDLLGGLAELGAKLKAPFSKASHACIWEQGQECGIGVIGDG